MSLKYRDKNGNETAIAGLNGLSGELVPSVSYYQTGSVTNTAQLAQTQLTQTIALNEEMPDTDYIVVVNSNRALNFTVLAKTTTSFTIAIFAPEQYGTIAVGSETFYWQAFKLMTDESRALDEQAIANNTEAIAELGAVKTSSGTISSNVGAGSTITCAKKGGVVTVVLRIASVPAGTTAYEQIALGTLPTGMRPVNTLYEMLGTNISAYVTISTGGVISYSNGSGVPSAMSYIWRTLTFVCAS